MRFCFDLDGTLVHPNESGGVDPVPTAIELVRQLHRAKHTIIITTSNLVVKSRVWLVNDAIPVVYDGQYDG